MKLLIFILLVAILARFVWKHKDRIQNTIRKAFADEQPSKHKSNNTYHESEVIPHNVRRNIIENQYMTLQDVDMQEDKTKDSSKTDSSAEQDKSSSSGVIDSNVDFDANTMLYDTNGEGFSVMNLNAATVNQADSSTRDIKFNPRKEKSRFDMRKQKRPESKPKPIRVSREDLRKNHVVTNAKTNSAVKSSKKDKPVNNDVLSSVRKRLSKFNSK